MEEKEEGQSEGQPSQAKNQAAKQMDQNANIPCLCSFTTHPKSFFLVFESRNTGCYRCHPYLITPLYVTVYEYSKHAISTSSSLPLHWTASKL